MPSDPAQVLPAGCQLLALLSDLYSDYCTASSAVEQVETVKCNVENFTAAVRATVKFRTSKKFTDIKQDIHELQKGTCFGCCAPTTKNWFESTLLMFKIRLFLLEKYRGFHVGPACQVWAMAQPMAMLQS